MAQERSFFWSRDRTYSVVIRDGSGALRQRTEGINATSASNVLEQYTKRYPTLTVTLHLDVHKECAACDGTGLLNKDYSCSKCDGRGMIITDQIGPEIPRSDEHA
jgi:DnaJ-class molecular chaperone